MLGVVIALTEEINNLLKVKFSDNFIHEINKCKFYILKTINNESVVLTFSGVGKTNAAAITATLISNFKIDKCLNIGSCAGYSDLDHLDVVIIDKTSYGDVDLTDFGYEINQIPKMPVEFATDQNMNKTINEILINSNYNYKLGFCITCDCFVKKENINKFNISKKSVATVIDMECAAIAQTCFIMNVKFASVKVVSDCIFSNNKSHSQYDNNINNVATIIDSLAYNIIQAIVYANKK